MYYFTLIALWHCIDCVFVCLCVCAGCCRGGSQCPGSLFRRLGPHCPGVFSGLCATGPLLQDPQRTHGRYWTFLYSIILSCSIELHLLVSTVNVTPPLVHSYIQLPVTFWHDSSPYCAHETCFFDQKDLRRLTWNPPRATVENKYNREVCFWELPLKSEKTDPTQWVKRFSHSAGINWCTMSEPLIRTYLNSSFIHHVHKLLCFSTLMFFLLLDSHRERLGLIWTQVLSQVWL